MKKNLKDREVKKRGSKLTDLYFQVKSTRDSSERIEDMRESTQDFLHQKASRMQNYKTY